MSEKPLVLAALDDLMCHQTITSVAQPLSTDPNWTEKGYVVAYDLTGEIMVAVGVGKYANRNVFDGFAGVVVDGKQYNVRASRGLWPDVDSTSVGPLSWTAVEPPRRLRVVLGPNDVGISFDVEFTSDYVPVAETGGRTRVRGVTANDTIRFFQLGRAAGTVTVEGRTYTLDPARTFAYKDRSWGVRGMTGPPASWIVENTPVTERREQGRFLADRAPRPTLSGMLCVDRGSEAICTTFAEAADGTQMSSTGAAGAGGFVIPAGTRKPLSVDAIQDMEWVFHPGTRRAVSMSTSLVLSDGSARALSAKTIGTTYYFRGGGYFGFRNWWQGKYMGELVVDGEVLDLSDKSARDELYGCEEIAASFDVDGEQHYGVLEPFAIGDLPKYGLTADHLG